MSVIIGLINNGKIIISADTLLAHLEDPNLSKDGFSKICKFTLDQKTYLIGAAGLGTNFEAFINTLKSNSFSKPDYNVESFSKEMQKILKANDLNHLTLLIGGISGNEKVLTRVRSNEMEIKNKEGGYFILVPDSVNNSLVKINEVIKNNSNLLPDKPLEFLRALQKEVAQIDNYRYVNDDFYYNILKNNVDVERPTKTDKGYHMD